MLGYSSDITPRLFVGVTLPPFSLCKNVKFSPKSYSLTSHLIKIVIALWNDGNERNLSPKEIDAICGKGAYGNHKKLSFAPWNLVENVPSTKIRRLTQHGKDFMRGNLKVPRSITQSSETGEWLPTENTVYFGINDLMVDGLDEL